ncbi:MAG: PilZ domain-containing protein [Hyphomicrobium sp.]
MSYRFRKAGRRQVEVPILLSDLEGKELTRGKSVDFSESGTKLQLSEEVDIPKRFILSISDGKVRRECELVWHTGTSLGARFIKIG